jgi:hypothetical protein
MMWMLLQQPDAISDMEEEEEDPYHTTAHDNILTTVLSDAARKQQAQKFRALCAVATVIRCIAALHRQRPVHPTTNSSSSSACSSASSGWSISDSNDYH